MNRVFRGDIYYADIGRGIGHEQSGRRPCDQISYTDIALTADKNWIGKNLRRMRMEIKYSDNVKLMVIITDQMIADYRECRRMAEVVGGDAKDCRTCSLGTEIVEDYPLCDLPVVCEEVERRITMSDENEMENIVTSMMEHICNSLCRHPREASDQEALDAICAECEMGQYSVNILNAYHEINDFERTQCAVLMKKYGGFVRCEECKHLRVDDEPLGTVRWCACTRGKRKEAAHE